jgi:hypothetical protein
MLRFAARQEEHERRRWHAVNALRVRQADADRHEALAVHDARLALYAARGVNMEHHLLRYHARKRRHQIILRDGYACRYCGTTTRRLELDHIHPLSRGGSNDDDNLALACSPCNLAKGTKTVDEWRAPASPDLD